MGRRTAVITGVLALLSFSAGPSRGQDDGRAPASFEQTLLQQCRQANFEQMKDSFSRIGGTGGFFPRVISNDLGLGLVIGTVRRHPDRLAELLPSKMELKDGFRPYYCGALVLAGGERALELLRAEPKDDAVVQEVLANVAKRKDLPLTPLGLDPRDKEQAIALFGILAVHSDAACAVHLATALAPAGAEAEGEPVERVRERTIAMLRAVCRGDPELRRVVADLRTLAAPAVRPHLDAVLAAGPSEEKLEGEPERGPEKKPEKKAGR